MCCDTDPMQIMWHGKCFNGFENGCWTPCWHSTG
jgi:acyl-CoA thioesterase FadM